MRRKTLNTTTAEHICSLPSTHCSWQEDGKRWRLPRQIISNSSSTRHSRQEDGKRWTPLRQNTSVVFFPHITFRQEDGKRWRLLRQNTFMPSFHSSVSDKKTENAEDFHGRTRLQKMLKTSTAEHAYRKCWRLPRQNTPKVSSSTRHSWQEDRKRGKEKGTLSSHRRSVQAMEQKVLKSSSSRPVARSSISCSTQPS